MVMPPQIPVAFEPDIPWKRPEITVLSLAVDEFAYHLCHSRPQLRTLAHAQGLDRGYQVLAYELARPGNQLGHRLPIANLEHFQHSWVGRWGREEPIIDIGFEPLA